jgi:hypothetical protein
VPGLVLRFLRTVSGELHFFMGSFIPSLVAGGLLAIRPMLACGAHSRNVLALDIEAVGLVVRHGD